MSRRLRIASFVGSAILALGALFAPAQPAKADCDPTACLELAADLVTGGAQIAWDLIQNPECADNLPTHLLVAGVLGVIEASGKTPINADNCEQAFEVMAAWLADSAGIDPTLAEWITKLKEYIPGATRCSTISIARARSPRSASMPQRRSSMTPTPVRISAQAIALQTCSAAWPTHLAACSAGTSVKIQPDPFQCRFGGTGFPIGCLRTSACAALPMEMEK